MSDADDVKLSSIIKAYAPDKWLYYYLSLFTSALSGILSILPFLFLYKLIEDFFISGFEVNSDVVHSAVLWIVVTQVLVVLLSYLSLTFSHLVAFRVESTMRYKGMQRLLSLPLGFFEHEDSGRLRRQVDDQASQTHSFIAHNVPDLARFVAIPCTFIMLLIYIDWLLALVTIVCMVLSMVLIASMLTTETKQLIQERLRSGEMLSVTGTEYVRGIPIIKLFQQSVESFQDFYQAIMRLDAASKNIVFAWRSKMILATLVVGLPTLILGPLALLLMGGSDAPALLFAKACLILLLSYLSSSNLLMLMSIQESKTQLAQSVSGMTRLNNEDIQEVNSDLSVVQNEHGVVFDKVSYTYPDREDKALSNFSFHFKPETSYALVGPSGSGKSTVVKLIARLYDVNEGSVRLDGKDVRSYKTDDLFGKMAIVFQENSLLEGSLRDNVTMGYQCSDEQVKEALAHAACGEILARIGSLDALLGKEGTYVSGGEKQRINIARAYLRKRPVLLLDEASAYADAENEQLITQSLAKIKTSALTISIAHRLTSIKDSDCILVMERGVLVASGTHDELMKHSSLYRTLVNEYEQAANWTLEEV